MSYLQGTIVKVNVRVSDPDTGLAYDPPDVLARIWPPTGPSVQKSFLTGSVQHMGLGWFRFAVDTSAAPGTWEYEVDVSGGDAVVKSRTLRVTARRPA